MKLAYFGARFKGVVLDVKHHIWGRVGGAHHPQLRFWACIGLG